ncbi:MAG: restriction endonuclease subunit S [Coriobacteriales bacterium]
MNEWQKARLGELADVKLGKMLDRKKNQGEYRDYIGNDNVQWGYFKLDEVKQMRIKDSEVERFRVKSGDLMVCEGGDPGRCALWESDTQMFYQKALNRVRVGDALNPRYLLYYMLHIGSTQEIRQYFTGGATIKHLPNTALKNVVIRYPSIDKQRKIAEILGAYDKLIENNRKQIALLEETAQRLYKEWFVDLRFPGYEKTKFIDGLPEGWKIVPLTAAFDFVRGKSYSSKDINAGNGVKLVTLKNIRQYGGWLHNCEKRYGGKYRSEQTVVAGDVVMAVTDMTKERRLVGHVALVPQFDETAIISMDLIKLVPKTVETTWLYAMLRFSGLAETIALFANGTNVLHLKPEALGALTLVRPKLEIQKQFAKIIDGYIAAVNCLSKQCNWLAEARDRLLPKLMSGEIEV